MSNYILEDEVLNIVCDFIDNGVLFTALDVSNKVKEKIPSVRHREVRDIVRNLWNSHMQVAANPYAKTSINVTLKDGSVVQALLYHPISDSWDLDNKYDVQKRAQVATIPKKDNSDNTQVNNVAQPVQSGTIPQQTQTNVQPLSPRDAWAQAFASQPSIFSRNT